MPGMYENQGEGLDKQQKVPEIGGQSKQKKDAPDEGAGWRTFWACCHRCRKPYVDGNMLAWGWFSYCKDCFIKEITTDVVEAAVRFPDWQPDLLRGLAFALSRISDELNVMQR
jgi:hypothetical protein